MATTDKDRAVDDRGERILAHDALARMDRLATLHEVYHTLKQYFEQRQPWSRMAALIGKDRVLTVKVWEAGKRKALMHQKQVHGPEKGGHPEERHIEQVLRVLGEQEIRKILLSDTEREMQLMMDEISLGCTDLDRVFWCHGALTGHAMVRLGDALKRRRSEQEGRVEVPAAGSLFRMGLLLDVGTLFVHLDDPESIRDIWLTCTRAPRYTSLSRGEWDLFHKHLHAIKGAQFMRLAGWSNLEAEVTEYHHDPSAISPESDAHLLVQCANVADAIASLLVSAPALNLQDFDLDAAAFGTVVGDRGPEYIREVVRAVVSDARDDGFNLTWSWPGYRELLNMVVPAACRSTRGDRARGCTVARPFSWWLRQNEGRVGEMLTRYHQRAKSAEADA